jgi:hypothetical protein
LRTPQFLEPDVGDAQLDSWKIRLIACLYFGMLALAIAAPATNDVAVVVNADVRSACFGLPSCG